MHEPVGNNKRVEAGLIGVEQFFGLFRKFALDTECPYTHQSGQGLLKMGVQRRTSGRFEPFQLPRRRDVEHLSKQGGE